MDTTDIKLIAECAVGFDDVSLAPDVVLALVAEIDRLNGLQPSLPPRPPEGYGLPRFGLRWNGPGNPLAVAMDDGYWTPWHLADQLKADRAACWEEFKAQGRQVDQLKAENEALLEGMARITHATRLGDPAFMIACEVVGELGVSKEADHEQV